MNASDVGSDVVADEALVRAALAAHPWPRFGEGLQGRLMAIAATAPDEPIEAHRDVRLPAADSAAPAAAPRGVRGWRREAWASAVVLATVAVLALALAGTVRLRQARPVEGPESAPPTPVATDAAIAPVPAVTDGLTGRLIYIEPGQGESNETVYALTMLTGKSNRLWDLPRTDTIGQRAVSPDGTRLAYARYQGESSKAQITVRHLVADAPEPAVLADPAQVDGLVWSHDSSALFYGEQLWQPSFESANATVAGWELHRLDLDDRRLDGETTTTLDGPPSWGIDAGEDRVVARLEAAAIGDENFPVLLAVDSANERAAVGIGPGENGWMDAIALIDINTGVELERVPAGGIAGFTWAPNRSGTKLAYTNCLGCYDGDEPYRVRVLTLATGEVNDIWSDRDGPLESAPLRWSPDDRWVHWTAGGWETTIVEVEGSAARAEDVPARLGFAVDIAPSGKQLLMSTGQVVDLTTRTSAGRHAQPLTWTPPSWLGQWNSYIGQFVAWVPDVDEGATAAQATAAPMSADFRVGTLLASAVVLTPVATVIGSPLLEPLPWSPDSRWLPFWTSDDAVDLFDPRSEAAQLNFFDATTGTVCTQPGAQRVTRSDGVIWERPDEVIVLIDGVPAIGKPCGALIPAPDSPHALPTARAGETPEWAEVYGGDGPGDSKGDVATGLSLDGQFTATTTVLDDESHYETVITRNSDGQRVAATTWTGGGGFGGAGLGGEWLPSGEFIIYAAYDKGPLVISPTDDVDLVAERFFNLNDRAPEPGSVNAFVHVEPSSVAWHLFLSGMGAVHLYHSDTESAEALPSERLWGRGISRDGRWLMIHGRDGEDGSNGGLWVRAIEAIGGPFRKMPWSELVEASLPSHSPYETQYAFASNDAPTLAIVSFPAGEVLGVWRLSDHAYDGARWSPDGNWVAIEGSRSNADGTLFTRGLYVLPLPPEP